MRAFNLWGEIFYLMLEINFEFDARVRYAIKSHWLLDYYASVAVDCFGGSILKDVRERFGYLTLPIPLVQNFASFC